MKKGLFVLGLLLSALPLRAQKYWDCSRGKIDFYSKTPVEDIEAHSRSAGAIVDTETGVVAFKVPIKTFDFPNDLMEEHFNENYMETGRFPFGTFSGKMEPLVDFHKPGRYPVKASGKLSIHGVEKQREFSGTVVVNADKTAVLTCSFQVLLEDHKIERPQLMLVKIADRIDVSVDFQLKPKP